MDIFVKRLIVSIQILLHTQYGMVILDFWNLRFTKSNYSNINIRVFGLLVTFPSHINSVTLFCLFGS